jgi:tryptophanyl-tRNA synthetase
VDLAQQFSRSYRPGVLREARALIAQTTATLPGLDGRKMSESYGDAISLVAEPDDMTSPLRRPSAEREKPNLATRSPNDSNDDRRPRRHPGGQRESSRPRAPSSHASKRRTRHHRTSRG